METSGRWGRRTNDPRRTIYGPVVTTYADFVPTQRFWFELAMSPSGDAVAYSADAGGGQFNLMLHPLDGSPPRQLTEFTDQAVRQIAWGPDGQTLYFTADRDGDEYFQVFRIGRDGNGLEALTDAAKVQHSIGLSPASPDGRRLAYAGNDREPTDQDLLLRDLESGEVNRALSPGTWLEPGHWSPDSASLSVLEFRSNTDIGIAVLAVGANQARGLLTDHVGKHTSVGWAASGDVLYVTTDADRDFVGLAAVNVSSGELQWLDTPDWDVEHAEVSADGRVLVWSVDVDGVSQVRARDLISGQPLSVPGIPPGSARVMSLSADGSRVALLIATGAVPFNVFVVDLAAGTARWLTDSRPEQADPATLLEPELVHYPTHDGREVPAYLYRPSGDGRFGVVLSIHGGPEWQERPCYNYEGLYQYLLANGIGVLAPNVRGSTGYGTAYQKLIHHDWGGDELRDFAHAHSYLTGLEWVDRTRIGVFGGSFGGFATLSCVSRLPDLWAAGVSIVGPSNLVTFCRSVPPTWQRTMAEWVGDVDTEEAFLLERSPITYVDDIVAPLFVIQGANDPRVVKAESDQIVDRLRGRGVDVRYDVYDDEGHGFIRRDNETKALSDTADFLIQHLSR